MKIETLIVKGLWSLVYYTKNLDIISCARCCHASRASRQIRCEDASKICDWRRNISFFRHWALRRVPTNVSQASTVRQFERSLVMILAMGKSGKTIRNVTYIHWIWIKTKIINLKWKVGLLKGDSRHENCLSNNLQNDENISLHDRPLIRCENQVFNFWKLNWIFKTENELLCVINSITSYSDLNR